MVIVARMGGQATDGMGDSARQVAETEVPRTPPVAKHSRAGSGDSDSHAGFVDVAAARAFCAGHPCTAVPAERSRWEGGAARNHSGGDPHCGSAAGQGRRRIAGRRDRCVGRFPHGRRPGYDASAESAGVVEVCLGGGSCQSPPPHLTTIQHLRLLLRDATERAGRCDPQEWVERAIEIRAPHTVLARAIGVVLKVDGVELGVASVHLDLA